MHAPHQAPITHTLHLETPHYPITTTPRHSFLTPKMRLYLWGSAVILGCLTAVFLCAEGIENYTHFEQSKEQLQQDIVASKETQKKAETLLSDNDLNALFEKINTPFAKTFLETWVTSLTKDYPCEVNISTPKATSHALGTAFTETYHGHLVTFHIKTFTEKAFFNLLDEVAEDAPFYGEIQHYALKRLQPLSDDVLIKLKNGEKVYLFEGTIDVLVIAKALS